MLSNVLLLLAVTGQIIAQELAPTDQTSFTYPDDGAGVPLPFPDQIAELTGLSDWPEIWVTPPFTPNMVALYNPAATDILPDITEPPLASDFCQTFDDGPTNVTSGLLDYLLSVNQKNTFFEIGSQISQNYLLTIREYSEGHEIADHTWSHPDLTTLTSEEVYAELAWTIYAIHSAIGQTPKLFRPPYGNINDQVRLVAAQLGLTAVIWTDDSNDWQIGSNDSYTIPGVEATVQGFIAAGGPVILLEHDLRAATVEVGQTVSGYIAKAGFVNCPIAAVFGDAQRYQSTSLSWPVAGSTSFDPSFNPINPDSSNTTDEPVQVSIRNAVPQS